MYKPPFEINEKILNLSSEINEKIGYLKPMNEFDRFPYLRKISRIQSVQSSLAIENNSLSINEASMIINGMKVVGNKEDVIAMTNAFKLYDKIDNLSHLLKSDLLEAHKIMMNDLLDDAGKFRNHGEAVIDGYGNIIHLAPPHEMVESHIDNLFLWMSESKLSPLIKSCVFHYEFEFIHPFTDGNGRLGRFWQTLILSKWKSIFKYIPIENIVKRYQQDYYDVINYCDKKGDSTRFIEFMLNCINIALDETIEKTLNSRMLVSNEVKRLMEVITSTPESAISLMQKLNLKNKDNFRNLYLKPALELGLIASTHPLKSRAKNQQYYKI